jgi:hypothetical protein
MKKPGIAIEKQHPYRKNNKYDEEYILEWFYKAFVFIN